MNYHNHSVPFVSYKALESLLIEDKETATESILSNMKEKREAKKDENIEKIKNFKINLKKS